eukprot:gene11945-5346_t
MDDDEFGQQQVTTFKVLFIGSSGVGKSCLIQRFVNNTFEDTYSSKLSTDFKTKEIKLGSDMIKVQLWEFACNKIGFDKVVESSYKTKDAVIMVYDITNQESFDDVASKWIPQMKEYGNSDILKYLVGTKSDFDSSAKVDSKKAKELADSEGFQYFITSSKSAEGVDKLFEKVGKDCLAARPDKEKSKQEKDKKEIRDAEAADKKKFEEIHQEPEKIIHPEPPVHFENEEPKKNIKYHTIIALGVVSRFKDNKQIDYLEKAVESLYNEFNRYKKLNSKEKFLVYVQNNDKTNRPIGYQKLKYNKKFKSNFKFKTVEKRYEDPFTDIPGHDYKHPNNVLPGHLARQQVCDVISMIDYILKNYSFKYLLFMEDDFIVCRGLLEALLINSKNLKHKDPKFCGIRLSYGMSGILLKRKDLMEYRIWAQSIINIMPIDNALQSFWFSMSNKDKNLVSCKKQNRKVYTYEKVMLEHIGDVSTFTERNKPGFRRPFPKCYSPINMAWNLNPNELFQNQCATKSLLSPC